MTRGLAALLLAATMASHAAELSSPIMLPEAEGIREGQALAREILAMQPARDSVSTAASYAGRPYC